MIEIEYDSGTLVVHCDEYAYLIQNIAHCQWDQRIKCFRLPGYQYFQLITTLCREKISYHDNARNYNTLQISTAKWHAPFPYQKESIECWKNAGKRGVIVLPTGTGKSFVGVMAIQAAARSTVVVVPTIDLMHQWYDTLKKYFPDHAIGLVGGGYFEPEELTVITYDSAYRHLERLGNRFGLIIFDECHHLPGATRQLGAKFALAPYRLGLSATPERMDGGHDQLQDLIGICVYRKLISEMSGDYLADYQVWQLKAQLSAEEKREYTKQREIYLNFVRMQGISLSKGNWHRFIIACSQSKDGRRAFIK